MTADPSDRGSNSPALLPGLVVGVDPATDKLRASNEELGVTTEELRSLNKELTTVNIQLRQKVDELEQTHDDLMNFFVSTKLATIFLDERLRIRRFTPAAEELLSLTHADIGRYVGDIARELLQQDFVCDAEHVLKHLCPRTREIQTGNDVWFTREALPYRTKNSRVEGVVVTLLNITEYKEAHFKLRTRERQRACLARLGMHALKSDDSQKFLELAVRDLHTTLQVDLSKVLEQQPSGGELLLCWSGLG
ncbi:MAG: PAS domain-containing protein [Myxococcota bacterium]